jgi:hypothetical protein
MSPRPPHRREGYFLSQSLTAALALACFSGAACSQTEAQRPPADVTVRHPQLVPPGTVIDKGPPKGWSHLIIKSQPRLAAGDVKQISETAARMSSMLFTTMLANVQGDRAANGQVTYRLSTVAVGMGTKVNGRDMVLSPDTHRKLGANLGLIGGVVFSKAYEKQQDVRVIARSATLAVLDAPVALVRNNQHRRVIYRYVLLLDPRSGRLETLLWLIDRDEQGRYVGPQSPIEWLAPNLLEDAALHVDAGEFTLGVPSDIAFATMRLPPGQRQLTFPNDLKGVAAQPQLTAAAAQQLERRLWEVLRQATAR